MQYEMKESGLGDIQQIPQTWEFVRVKHRYNVFCGATPAENPENWDGDIAWIGPADMNDFGKISEGKRKITQVGYDSCGTHILPKNSVVLSTRAPIGKIQITENELCTNQGCKSMVKRYEEDSISYLAYYLFSIKERLEVAGTGTTFKELSTSNLKNMPLLLPSPTEQQAIAAYLDEKYAAIDGIIAEAKATIDEYKSWKASVIFEAVTKGLNPNAEMKDSGVEWIGKIPQKWIAIKFKYLLRIKSGDAIRNETLSETGHYPVYGGGELIGYNSDFNVEKNTILVGRVGARCGCITKISEKAWATDNALIITNKFNGDYIFYLLVAADLNKLNTSNAQPLITATKINNHFTAFTYDSDEQCKIVEYLNEKCAAIDGVIAEKEALIGELESYRKSLIFETVTGKRRVAV